MNYKFQLRQDMPRGFLANSTFPELPAIVRHLKQYDGLIYNAPFEFKQTILKNYLEALATIPVGPDPHLREGLLLKKLPKDFAKESRFNDYSIYAKSTSHAGVCVFGFLKSMK